MRGGAPAAAAPSRDREVGVCARGGVMSWVGGAQMGSAELLLPVGRGGERRPTRPPTSSVSKARSRRAGAASRGMLGPSVRCDGPHRLGAFERRNARGSRAGRGALVANRARGGRTVGCACTPAGRALPDGRKVTGDEKAVTSSTLGAVHAPPAAAASMTECFVCPATSRRCSPGCARAPIARSIPMPAGRRVRKTPADTQFASVCGACSSIRNVELRWVRRLSSRIVVAIPCPLSPSAAE